MSLYRDRILGRGLSWPVGFRASFGAALDGGTDLVHVHGLWLAMPNIATDVAVRRGIPVVTSPRGMASPVAMKRRVIAKQVAWYAVQRRALERSACLHATSEKECEELRDRGLRVPVAVVPNAVDIPEENSADARSSERPVLLYLGRIWPGKGLEDLLSAWAGLGPDSMGWNLEIAGPIDSRYSEGLVARVNASGIVNIRFPGRVVGEHKTSCFRRASLFVLPSRSESFGQSVAEALAHSLPVVVSAGTPWKDVVARRCGWYHEQGAEALRASLQSALACEAAELRRMGARGRDWMSEEFSWPAVAREMIEVYSWVLGRSARPMSVRGRV